MRRGRARAWRQPVKANTPRHSRQRQPVPHQATAGESSRKEAATSVGLERRHSGDRSTSLHRRRRNPRHEPSAARARAPAAPLGTGCRPVPPALRRWGPHPLGTGRPTSSGRVAPVCPRGAAARPGSGRPPRSRGPTPWPAQHNHVRHLHRIHQPGPGPDATPLRRPQDAHNDSPAPVQAAEKNRGRGTWSRHHWPRTPSPRHRRQTNHNGQGSHNRRATEHSTSPGRMSAIHARQWVRCNGRHSGRFSGQKNTFHSRTGCPKHRSPLPKATQCL